MKHGIASVNTKKKKRTATKKIRGCKKNRSGKRGGWGRSGENEGAVRVKGGGHWK